MVPGQGCRAVALAAAVPPAGRRAGGAGDGVCAGRPVPLAALAGRRGARARPTTTRGPPTPWPGRCWPCSTPRSTSPGARRSRGTSATSTPAPRPSCGAAAATPSRPGWPGCSRRTPCSGPTLLADWLDGRDTDGRGGDARRRPGLAARAVAAAASTGSARHRRTGGTRTPWPGCATSRQAFDLPERLSLFGHTRLPVTEVELLGAVGRAPRRAPLAAAPQRRAVAARSRRSRGRRRCDARPTTRATSGRPPAAGHPRPRQPRAAARARGGPATDDQHRPMPRRAGHAARLAAGRPARQRPRARRARRSPPTTAASRCTPATAPARQVDVLREVLLGLLEDDPTLEPRDMLVMCPDIETYAPLITAGVRPRRPGRRRPPGPPAAGPARRPGADARPTRCSASPRSCSTSPAAGPPPARCSTWPRPSRSGAGSASPTTTWTPSPRWVRESGVRWALRPRAPRRRSGWPASAEHLAGRARPGAAGVAMSADARTWLGTTLPLDDVGSTDIELAGRFAEFVDRLRRVHRPARPAPGRSRDWLDGAGERRSTALTAVGRDDAWQVGQVRRELADGRRRRRRAAGRHRAAAARRPGAARRPAGRPPDPRQLPHRHADGLHDGADALGAAPGGLPARARRRRLPARSGSDGDDVLARDPSTGERDVRSEDRQLLLDAILAATETW